MNQSDHTAVLFFSRTPQEEARCKRIVSRRKTLAISRTLQEHSLEEAQRIGSPVFQYTGKQQRGDSFGERLANAIEATFAKGFERLLIIGNDTPDLDAALLRKARESLNDDKLILGPATDGGVYLIGLTAQTYQRDAFIHLAWKTAQLQHTFTAYAQDANLSIICLASLADIDNTLDFWAFLHSLPAHNPLKAVFLALLPSYNPKSFGHYTIPFHLVDDLGCRSLRAPPTFVY